MSAETKSHESDERGREYLAQPWEQIGRVAEHFARRVARDASKFATRMEAHTSDLARDVSREWRRARHHHRRGVCRPYASADAGDVRAVFEDVRRLIADILDGVDEMIGGIFAVPPKEEKMPAAETDGAAPDWVKVVANRDVQCSACERAIAAGEEAFVRSEGRDRDFRCSTCAAAGAEG